MPCIPCRQHLHPGKHVGVGSEGCRWRGQKFIGKGLGLGCGISGLEENSSGGRGWCIHVNFAVSAWAQELHTMLFSRLAALNLVHNGAANGLSKGLCDCSLSVTFGSRAFATTLLCMHTPDLAVLDAGMWYVTALRIHTRCMCGTWRLTLLSSWAPLEKPIGPRPRQAEGDCTPILPQMVSSAACLAMQLSQQQSVILVPLYFSQKQDVIFVTLYFTHKTGCQDCYPLLHPKAGCTL